jgi:hypothetical protein
LSRKGVDWFISLVPEIGYTLLPFGAAPENAFPIYGGQFALIKQVASAHPRVRNLLRARCIDQLRDRVVHRLAVTAHEIDAGQVCQFAGLYGSDFVIPP